MPGSYSHMPSNVPNYMNEYANAYMHPNRNPLMSPYHSHHRPPPGINTSSAMLPPPIGSNNGFYYANNTNHGLAQHQQSIPNQQSAASGPFSNLIDVTSQQYDSLSSNVDCFRKQTENRRRPAIAVQKGNVLEIVPNAELQSDKNADLMEPDKVDKVHLIEKHHQQALQRQKQERIKRKMERNQRRLAREKRKEFLMAEINRMSNQMIVGDDGKMIRAGELLKSMSLDGTNIKLESSTKDQNDNDGQSIKVEDKEDEEEEIIIKEPVIYTYDPRAAIGKSILSERNLIESTSASK